MISNLIRRFLKKKQDKQEHESFELYKKERLEFSANNMRRMFFSKNLIPNTSTLQIIYLPGNRPEYESSNKYVAEHLEDIKKRFHNGGYTLFYLPEILSLSQERIRYHKPDIDKEEVARISGSFDNAECDIYSFADNAGDFPLKEAAFIRYIGSYNDDYDTEDCYMFSYHETRPMDEDVPFVDILEVYLSSMHWNQRLFALHKPPKHETADYYFNSHTQSLMQEVRDRLDLLRQYGVSEMILKDLFEPSTKVSSLYITKDYRLFLTDYNNIEIKLEPLNKAVFLLFLQHEEGILFKYLTDYRDELESIYMKITRTTCKEKQRLSIAAICDPTKNSINEKCARIREAFISEFDERLAQNYFVTGNRGEVKRIILSRDLVKWENK